MKSGRKQMSKKSDFSSLDLLSAYEQKKKNSDRISLSDIIPDPNQPRIFGKNETADLVDSMSRLGLIEPIILRKENNKFTIIAGERRFHAALSLGWKEIAAVVVEASPDICYEMSLAENEKRKSLNPWEVGKAIQFLRKDRKKTAEEVSKILGYTERYVKQLSSIARLDLKSVSDFIKQGNDPSVKNLERLLKQKEGRGGEIISPDAEKFPDIVRLNIKHLTEKNKEHFLKELSNLKKKYNVM